jgi:uncharacterized protein
MRPALTVVTLGVDDLDRSIRFYRDILKWPTTAKPEDGVAFFDLNGVILSLFGRGALAEDANVPDDGEGFDRIALAHNVRTKEEVDEIFKELEAAGVTITKSPQDVFWGGYCGYFADPDGHLWEVAWNPHWKMDEAGRPAL